MTTKPTIYLDTTIVSAIIGRLSSIPENKRKQEFTRDWWKEILPLFIPVISTYVFEEASDGDDRLAMERRKKLVPFRLLLGNEGVLALADEYMLATKLPEKVRFDAFHLACATIYKIDYLVTWNCTHINNAVFRRIIENINRGKGIATPIICTPEELTEVI